MTVQELTTTMLLPVDRLQVDPQNPRRALTPDAGDDLAASVAIHGVLEPLLVRAHGDSYGVVAGSRRLAAARAAGLTQVPCVVHDLSDVEALTIGLAENIARRSLNPVDEAEAFERLIEEHDLSHAELARRVGVHQTTISARLRLLTLPEAVVEDLRAGTITMAKAERIFTARTAARRPRPRRVPDLPELPDLVDHLGMHAPGIVSAVRTAAAAVGETPDRWIAMACELRIRRQYDLRRTR